jgi:tetratricopeptide (TPR) repeat protein
MFPRVGLSDTARRQLRDWPCLLAVLCATAACSPPSPAGDALSVVTFSEDVAPILFAKCAGCHRPIDDAVATRAGRSVTPDDPLCVAGAPFSVLDYRAVRTRASAIAQAVTRRAMPPWLPVPGHGEFLNERRLEDREIALIRQWVQQGAVEGDPARRPPPPPAQGGWQLGQPDLVLTLPQPYAVDGAAGDVFRNFVLPVSVTATRYVRGVEFRTDNPRVLHHASVARDASRLARALDRADAGPGFATMPDADAVQNVYGWSPGKVPVLDPADTAWTLDPGADLVVQLHLVPRSAGESVQPMVGLFFSEEPPTRAPVVIKLESKAIDIPAGAASHVIEDRYVLPADVDAISIYPHAHALATRMRGTATRPDGTDVPLVRIEAWDLRWQDQYRYRTPVFLPKGTTIAMRFEYDNSASNPRNPHRPPQRVRWGPRSTDEMGALWLEVVPRRREDAAVLVTDYFRRARQADIDAAELAVRSGPADAGARNALATRYVQAGRLADAHAQLTEALRLEPGLAEAHSNLGSVLQAMGRIGEALPHLHRAVRSRPDDDRLHFNLGNGLLAAGDVQRAIRELERAIQLNPDNADAHFNLAMVLGPQRQIDAAIRHLRRVIEINPRYGEAYRNLALAYSLQGRLHEAVTFARDAVRLLPDSGAARDQLQQLLAATAPR